VNPMSVRGQHFMVTGASSGIGRSTAILLHALGAHLSLIDTDEKGLDSLCSELNSPERIKGYVQDLSNIPALETLVNNCVISSGRFNGFVHCAGVQLIVPLRTLEIEQWRKIFSINTESALMLSKLVSSRKFFAGPSGSIVFISSVMASVGSVGSVAYSMSKAALEGIARSLSLELAPRRIRVNCIAPGFVRTPLFEKTEKLWDENTRKAVEDLHPLGFGTPEDIANAVSYLLADTGRWITGSTLVVDGGYLVR
jgi:NAD(P)-dependent dehydrogenase (short-subunit alcohol dehydrogenase family)